MERILERMQKKLGYKINETYGSIQEYDLDPNADIEIISPKDAFDMLWNSAGKIFTAVFKKKDGSERVLTARRHVQKGVTGAGLKYKPSQKGLIPCYEMIGGQQGGFKMVNIHTLEVIKFQGQTYSVDQSQPFKTVADY